MSLKFQGTATDKKSHAEVSYALADGDSSLTIVTRVKNSSDEPLELHLVDGIRADGEFEFGQLPELGLVWAEDRFWGQAYGTVLADRAWLYRPDKLKRGESPELRLERLNGAPPLAAGETREVVRYLIPAANLLDVLALGRDVRGESLVPVEFSVKDAAGPVALATVEVQTETDERVGQGQTDEQGRLTVRLPAGKYKTVT